jgi:hypothetical protein
MKVPRIVSWLARKDFARSGTAIRAKGKTFAAMAR